MLLDKKRNILIISYYYPPIKTVGSLRAFYLTKNLNKDRWDTYVFSTTNYRLLDTDENFQRLSSNAKKVNLPTLDLRTLKTLISKFIARKNIIPSSGVVKIAHSLPFNIFCDGGLLFTLTGFFKGLYYIKKYKIGYIHSTYSPYSDHIIAFLLKLFNRRLVWIADFRDLPFGDSAEDIYLPRFQRKFNKAVLKRADCLVAVSEGLREKLEKYNPKTRVIRNGIPLDLDLADGSKAEALKTETFNIVYTGTLYAGKSDASLLFKTLKNLADKKEIGRDFKLIYAGKQEHLWLRWAKESGMMDNIEILGYLDRDKVLDLQNKASINLVLTWSNENEKGIITGKFYEYLAANKPLLCIITGDKDKEIEDLYGSINGGLVIYNKSDEERRLEAFIKELYREWKEKGHVSWAYNKDFLNTLRYENLSKELEEVFLGNTTRI